MTDLKIIEEKPLSLVDVREKLNEIKKKNKELSERGTKTKEYIDSVVKLTKKQAEELREKIIKLNIPRFKDRHINKLLDVMPTDIDSIRVLFSGESLALKPEDIKQLTDVMKDYS